MDPVPSSLALALADRYRLEREIGAGGMATVYLAKDVRHDRDVAVKVLRPEVASSIGAERFLAEIKTTAHLQHPHILGLIDSGEVSGTVFYVMPFVKGESLRDRLNRELQMPVADAVRIATQVASALDYAHRHGVIHRDIKPENILLHDEQALVADFGIALAASRSQSGKRITEAGTSLGTPHYMSPEQAMGERSLDARADIYALGCVLYEMLTGEPPFNGPNAQAIIAKVMTAEPEPVTTVRKTVPANVAAATMMAISKLPADRFPTAAAFAAALENVQFSGPRATALLVPHGAFLVRKSVVFAVAAAVLVACTAVFALIAKRESSNAASSVPTRFEIPLDASMVPNQVHVARNGKSILWSAAGGFWERPLDSLGVRRLRDAPPQQGGIRDVSPDGREVLVGGRGGLSIVPLVPGAARELGVAAGGRGSASWSDNGNIYVAFGTPGSTERGVVRVPATGGKPDTVARWKSDRAIRELVAVPGGKTLLAIQDTPGRADVDTLVAIDVGSGNVASLAAGAQQVRFVPPGYVLYTTSQALMVARFDASRRTLSDAVPFVESATGFSALAASRDLLVYRTGGDPLGEPGIDVRNVNGSSARPLPGIPDTILFSGFTVSPDGRRLAASGIPVGQSANGGRQVSNLYVYELPNGPLQLLRSTETDVFPAWMSGGRDLSFTRVDSATGRTTLMRRPWDGSAAPDTIYRQQSLPIGPASWFPSGKRGIAQFGGIQGGGRGGRAGAPGFGGRGSGGTPSRGDTPARGSPVGSPASDLMFITSPMNGEPAPFMHTEYNESTPAVSPDGRFIAYMSNSSTQNEVYVSPVDGSARRQVSRNGGVTPKWSRSGRELFFRSIGGGTTSDTLFAARIDGGAEITVSQPVVVFSNVSFGAGYGILPGDSLFVSRPTGSNARRPLVVVTNLSAALAAVLNGR